jgi:hypothetical protein
MSFGPFRPGLDPTERIAQWRSLGSIAAMLVGSHHPLVAQLRAAERDEAASAQALDMVDALPSLTRRRLLATFGAVTWPRSREGNR